MLDAWGYLPLFGLAAILSGCALFASKRLGAAVRVRKLVAVPNLARALGRRADKAF